jgi:hypothetical protein
MAHFYGSMQGAGGETTRTGTKASGIKALVLGWDVGVQVDLFDVGGETSANIYTTGGANGANRGNLVALTMSDLEGLRDGTKRLQVVDA